MTEFLLYFAFFLYNFLEYFISIFVHTFIIFYYTGQMARRIIIYVEMTLEKEKQKNLKNKNPTEILKFGFLTAST